MSPGNAATAPSTEGLFTEQGVVDTAVALYWDDDDTAVALYCDVTA